MSGPLLVFTDLDGTLLDHDSYDYAPALPALERLRACACPVIPVSSKTLAELEVYLSRLALDGPVVAENGAVIRLPGSAPQITPPGYAGIRQRLNQWREHEGLRFRGFGDMTDQELVGHTGLPPDAAPLARQRLASEPILWEGDAEGLERLRELARTAGLQLLQGGRFYHLLGDMDKGRAVRRIGDWYGSRNGRELRTVGLGDSGNDLAMLLQVDIPIIIRKKDRSHLQLPQRPRAIITQLPGPAGWNQALNQLLDTKQSGD